MSSLRNRKEVNDVRELPVDGNLNSQTMEKSKISFQDKQSICVLTFLYILQGIPLGLAGSVPLILQSKKVSYSTQATFSFVFWPFSLKILWAPIVDSIFFSKFGRRKTWLIPSQYLIGLTMIYVSYNSNNWLNRVDNGIDILRLTASFFLLNFLAATQDIAVDGWALTMLSRKSVGWASTCNTVGQTVGYFIAFIVFLALESSEFCNSWLRSVPQATGLVTFEGFLHFWGIVFMITTTLVMIFKQENIHVGTTISDKDANHYDGHSSDEDDHQEVTLTMWQTYQTLWRIIKLRQIMLYVVTLVFIKFGFSATDSITGLKLIEIGVSKEKMAFIGSLMVPMQILLALAVSKHTSSTAPLNVFIKAVIPRLLFAPLFCVLVYVTPWFQQTDGSYSFQYYIGLAVIYSSHQIFVYPMFVSMMAFYARISDPAIGGTYMTLLNTVSNLAFNIPSTIMLYLVDYLTVKRCVGGPLNGMSCSNKSQVLACTESMPKGSCDIEIDGYFIEVVVCTVVGLFAILTRRHYLEHVQQLPLQTWRIFNK